MSQQLVCTHFDLIQDVTPSADGCQQCIELGDPWVNLRMCKICGQVGCCDDSKNKHATKHYHSTRHPIMKSIMPGEDWMWCFVDEVGIVPP